MMKDWCTSGPCLVAIGAVLAGTALAGADQHGRYLPDEDTTTPVNEYGNAMPTMFDRDVEDTTKEIDAGEIRFDYDVYSADPAGNAKGGGALAGGFFPNENVKVKDGFTLAWVQTIIASTTGANDWNLPQTDAGEFPDATPGDRAYPFRFLPPLDAAVMPPPMPGFQDFPCRNFAAGTAESWLAELGLVCIADSPDGDGVRQAKVVGTFLWGFNWPAPAAPFGVGTVNADPPGFWGAPTQSYLDTLNEFYDGMGGGGAPDGMGGMLPPVASGMFNFTACDNCFQVNATTSFCPGDITGDGVVGIADLLLLLGEWGPCDGCASDIDGDMIVGISDLLTVLGDWGDCPKCGDPEAGDCCEPNGTPGCNDADCCSSVCAIDPFCCDVSWDQACVDLAQESPACDCAVVEPVACCLPDGTCVDLTPKQCFKAQGSPGGPGSACQGDGDGDGIDDACTGIVTQACCLSDGTCLDLPALVCELEVNGTPLGLGSFCQGDADGNGVDDACKPFLIEACCLPGGGCTEQPAMFCIEVLQGLPQGPGSFCLGDNDGDGVDDACPMPTTAACCLPDGSCVDTVPSICTDLFLGVPQPLGSFCLGDNDGDGVDDACPSGRLEACCLQDGSCVVVTLDECLFEFVGQPLGPGSVCLGDNDGDGFDDACPFKNIVACCFDDGSCVSTSDFDCVENLGGFPQAPGSFCLGDTDGDGADDACGAVGPTCPPGAAGSCFQPHPSPGCDDPQCCQAVCDVDPFCCDTEWDDICAQAAVDMCLFN